MKAGLQNTGHRANHDQRNNAVSSLLPGMSRENRAGAPLLPVSEPIYINRWRMIAHRRAAEHSLVLRYHKNADAPPVIMVDGQRSQEIGRWPHLTLRLSPGAGSHDDAWDYRLTP